MAGKAEETLKTHYIIRGVGSSFTRNAVAVLRRSLAGGGSIEGCFLISRCPLNQKIGEKELSVKEVVWKASIFQSKRLMVCADFTPKPQS